MKRTSRNISAGKRGARAARKRLDSSPLPGRTFALPPTVSKPDLLDTNRKTDRCFRQFLYDFSVLGDHLEKARAYLASQLGLSSPQYNVVMIVAQYQGKAGVSVSEVARHLHVTTAFIAAEAARLNRMGWIRKHPNPRDGRGVLLRLSPRGQTKILRIGPRRLAVNDHLFRSLSGKKFHQLARTVASLIDDFSETIQLLAIGR